MDLNYIKSFDTLSEAIKALQSEGYTTDFNLNEECIECKESQIRLNPEDFDIDAYYRFEGMSNTDDNSILYAISSKSGMKGLLVDAYGVYSNALSDAMIKKLTVKHEHI